VSNDGHCCVCAAVRAARRLLPLGGTLAEITRVVFGAYIEGLEDEGVAQRDRFCLMHRREFDALLDSDPELAIFDPFRARNG
jgi:hypothetical protein